MPFVFDVLKVLLSKTCKIQSPDLLFIWRYCTFVPLFLCWWFILKKHDLTLTVTLTLRRMQKCNSAIVLLSNFISADIIFHKFLPTSFNISLSKKYIYIYLCWIFLFSIYGQNLLSVTKVFCCVDAPALNETILSEQNC